MSLVLPDPKAVTPAQVADLGQQVVSAAESTDDPHVVTDLSNKWAAITEYLRRTSTEGINQAETTKARLLARIGALSPSQHGGDRRSDQVSAPKLDRNPLPPSRMSEARKLAAHPEVIEDVSASSTDEDPATKAKILREIAERQAADKVPVVVAKYPDLQPLVDATTDAGKRVYSDTAIVDMGHRLDAEPHRLDGIRRTAARLKSEAAEPERVPDLEARKACPHCGHELTPEELIEAMFPSKEAA